MSVVSFGTGVTPSADCEMREGILGETVAAGEWLYLDSTTNKYMKGVANGTVAQANVNGLALNGGVINQPVKVARSGTVNGLTSLKPGSIYALANVAGDVSDDYSTDLTEDASYVTIVAVALSATSIRVAVTPSGVRLNLV